MSSTAKLLVVAYGISWGIACTHPGQGVIVLCVASSLITLPFFIILVGRRYLVSVAIYFMLLVVALLIPPLWPLVGVWGLVCLIMKCFVLLRNLPAIVLGAGLYVLTYYAPLHLFELARGIPVISADLLLVMIIGLAGTLILFVILRAMSAADFDADKVAPFMLGSMTYLTLFILTLLLPAAGDSEELT